MSEENVELVKRAYEAFNPGDLEPDLEFIDPDVEFDVSRTNPEGGVYRGIEGFAELMSQWLGTWDDYSLELLELIDAGEGGVVAVMREKGKIKGSESWTEHIRGVVWTFKGARIARYEEHQDRAAALKAAGLRE
jgi:ketosteroid isomerase-like protein